jgi:hypothetical protein
VLSSAAQPSVVLTCVVQPRAVLANIVLTGAVLAGIELTRVELARFELAAVAAAATSRVRDAWQIGAGGQVAEVRLRGLSRFGAVGSSAVPGSGRRRRSV